MFADTLSLGLLVLPALVNAHGHLTGVIGKGTNEGMPYPMHRLGALWPDVGAWDCRGCAETGAMANSSSYDEYKPSCFLDGSKPAADQMETYSDTSLIQCHGRPKGTPNMTLAAGETIDIIWDFAVNHPGPSALYMSFDNDQTWVLLSQQVDTFVKWFVKDPDVVETGQQNVDFIDGIGVIQRVVLPANLPASTTATLRGEWLNTQGYEMFTSCVDVITTGPGKIPTDGFVIEGTPDGPSHLLGLLNKSSPFAYKNYPDGTNYVTNGIQFRDYADNIWPNSLHGPKVYDFGTNDYAFNVENTANQTNHPPHLYASTMNPVGATPATSVAGAATSTSTSSTSSTSQPAATTTTTMAQKAVTTQDTTSSAGTSPASTVTTSTVTASTLPTTSSTAVTTTVVTTTTVAASTLPTTPSAVVPTTLVTTTTAAASSLPTTTSAVTPTTLLTTTAAPTLSSVSTSLSHEAQTTGHRDAPWGQWSRYGYDWNDNDSDGDNSQGDNDGSEC